MGEYFQNLHLIFDVPLNWIVNLLMIGYGLKAGWATSNVLLLTSNETPLPSGKITMEEASWITSLMPCGSMFGNVFFGFITKKFGRKKPLMSISIPMMVSFIENEIQFNCSVHENCDWTFQTSWMLILFAQNPIYLYVARLLHGFCIGGILLMIPVYLTEISNDR